MIVRRAVAQDIPALALMGKEFFALTRYAETAEYDYASIIKTLAGMIKTGSLFVAAKDEIVAYYGAVITPFCWNENYTIANELFWYGTPKGMVLVADKAIKEIGTDFICGATLESMNPQATRKFYERRGFENMGHFYMKDLRCPQ